MTDYAIVKCTRCGKDRWDGPSPVCWPCQQEEEAKKRRCTNCGLPMFVQPGDTVRCACDDEPVPYRGQTGTGY